MSELSELYKQAILDHNRKPRNFGRPDNWTHHAEGLNALCGDRVVVYLSIKDDVLEAVHYTGESCAIAMASASMMTEISLGLTLAEWQHKFELFKRLMDKNEKQPSFDELGQVNILVSVKKFPSRIKSTTLCWYTADAAIKGLDSVTTE